MQAKTSPVFQCLIVIRGFRPRILTGFLELFKIQPNHGKHLMISSIKFGHRMQRRNADENNRLYSSALQ